MEDTFVQVLTIGGPVAAIAILSIIINYRFVCMWMKQNTEALLEVTAVLSEMNAVLKRLNGKVSTTNKE